MLLDFILSVSNRLEGLLVSFEAKEDFRAGMVPKLDAYLEVSFGTIISASLDPRPNDSPFVASRPQLLSFEPQFYLIWHPGRLFVSLSSANNTATCPFDLWSNYLPR